MYNLRLREGDHANYFRQRTVNLVSSQPRKDGNIHSLSIHKQLISIDSEPEYNQSVCKVNKGSVIIILNG